MLPTTTVNKNNAKEANKEIIIYFDALHIQTGASLYVSVMPLTLPSEGNASAVINMAVLMKMRGNALKKIISVVLKCGTLK